MKVFLWNEKQFFAINRKEEIDSNTFLITDFEESMIKETLDNGGVLWLDNGEIKWSGKRPDEVHIWDDASHSWIIDDVLFEARLETQQEHMWEKIKSKRLEEVTSGVLVNSVNKKFHTDETSAIQYSNVAGMIALNNYEPVQWKVMDNTWVLLTKELFIELQKAMNANTQATYAIAEHHKEAMLLLDDPSNYDFSTGWTNGVIETK